MKIKLISTIVISLLVGLTVQAVTKLEKIKVKGQCDMCENRINEAKTSLQNVYEAIAKVGHDTLIVKATDDAYNELPACCKYDRSAVLKITRKPMKPEHR